MPAEGESVNGGRERLFFHFIIFAVTYCLPHIAHAKIPFQHQPTYPPTDVLDEQLLTVPYPPTSPQPAGADDNRLRDDSISSPTLQLRVKWRCG